MNRWLAPWRGAQGISALGVLLSMVLLRSLLLGGSYFNQDDFYLSGRAGGADLTIDFLTRDTAGHINPFQQLAYWLLAHIAPYDWGVTATFVLVLQVSTTVFCWLVLTRLLGERWSRVVLLAVFAWAPLTLATTLWWSAAMGLWPHLLCTFVAVWLLVRWRQGDGAPTWSAVGIVLATVVGLLWHERAVLIVPVLAGVAVCLADEAVGWRRLPAALGRFRWLWVSQTLLLIGFLAAHSILTDVEGGESTMRQRLEVSWSFVARNVLPGFYGGPWVGEIDGGAVRPAAWSVVVVLVLSVGTIVLLWLRGGPARRWGLAVLAGYVLADLALLLSGRAGFGSIIGLDPRYSSDTIHALVLCLALCLRGAPPWLGLVQRRSPTLRRAVVVGLLGAYAVLASAGSALLVPQFQNVEDRTFVTNVRTSLALDPTVVLLDRLAPAGVVLPLVGEDSLLSRVLGPLPEDIRFDEPSARLRQVRDDGTLAPIEFSGSIAGVPGPDDTCGYPVRSTGAEVDFALPLDGRVVVRLAYFADEESTVTVTVDDWSVEFLARRGPQEMWIVVPELPGLVESMHLRGDGRSVVCVTGVEAGLPETS